LAIQHGHKADLCVVLGSSLTVTPAADIPREVGSRKQKLVICNLQKTPLDSLASVRVFAKCDDFMSRVMAHLEIEVPKWHLHRRVVVSTFKNENQELALSVQGVDVDGIPASILAKCDFAVAADSSLPAFSRTLTSEPFVLSVKDFPSEWASWTANPVSILITLHFMCHYLEPSMKMHHEMRVGVADSVLHHLEYNPWTREWNVVPDDSSNNNNLVHANSNNSKASHSSSEEEEEEEKEEEEVPFDPRLC